MLASRTGRGAAFLLGLGFALLPSFGPFAALLFVVTARLRFGRSDLPWLAAALLSAGTLSVHRGLTGTLFGLLQVLGPWAVYRAFAQLRQPRFDRLPKAAVLQGLLVGFGAVVVIGFATVRLDFAYPPVTQAITWGGDPTLFAHMVMVVGSLIALLATDSRLRVLSLALAGVGVGTAGSLEATLGLLIVLAYFLVRSMSMRAVGPALAIGALAGVLVVTVTMDRRAGLGPADAGVGLTSAMNANLALGIGSASGRPGVAGPGPDFASDRWAMWRAAWTGIAEHPWVGRGPGTFSAYFERLSLSTRATGSGVPAHAHDLFLEVLFERGIVGLAGLFLLIAGLAWGAARDRDAGLLAILAAVLVANVFDYTFFFGGVIYPLAAVAGWRSGRRDDAARPVTDSLSRQLLVRLTLAALDLGLAWLAFATARWILGTIGIPGLTGSGLAGYALLLWPAMAWREGLYPGYGLTEPDELKRQVLGACYAGALFLIADVVFSADVGVAPSVAVATTLLSAALLPMGRAAGKRALRALGLWGRPVVILGGGVSAANVARTLMHRSLDGLRPVAVFADRAEPGLGNGAMLGGVPLVGPISAANAFARREGIHHAVVAMDPEIVTLGPPTLDPEEDAFTIIQYVPDLPGLPVLGVRAGSLDNLLALEVRNELADPANRTVKRFLDVSAALVGGLVLSPVLLILAVVIRVESRGPLFFAHERIGRGGRKIRVWKFRTMVEDAKDALERHLDADPAARLEWEANHKLKDDPRVTRVGLFLRRFSLDELPQLWNVLKGEMSLVGPRPIVEAEVAKYADAFDLYSMVRPGMTGYWQISGRSDTDYDQRVELDSFYVRNWSVWLDIVVLLKTVSVVLKRDGAY